MTPAFLNRNAARLLAFGLAAICAGVGTTAHAGTDVRTLGAKADGKTDDTVVLQAALDAGQTDLEFSAGEYFMGGLKLPAGARLHFDARAHVVINPAQIIYREEVLHGGKKRMETRQKPLLEVAGAGVRIEGLQFDFTSGATPADPTPVDVVVQARKVRDLNVSGCRVLSSIPMVQVPLEKRARWMSAWQPAADAPRETQRKDEKILLQVEECENVTMEGCEATRITHMLEAMGCANVTSRGNRMTTGHTMTTFSRGSAGLHHCDNWSRDVNYQVVWRGGSPDPSRKAETVPLGSSTVVKRGVKPGDPEWNPHTAGVFDVTVSNNYADYGTTLAWGNKGRQIVIDGNISRFMADYAYGSEGGENIVFSNNIAINSTAGGIVSMYWGEKLLITGNLVMTRHEPCDLQWSRYAKASGYLGGLVRLHHGPSNPEDHYGAGSTLISGNLFYNELTQVARGVSVQGSRDVTVSGNKFVNGGVSKGSAGELTVIGNEFISRQSAERSVISAGRLTTSVIVRGNVLRREPAVSLGTQAEKLAEKETVPYFLFTEKTEKTEEDEEEKPLGAAINVSSDHDLSGTVQDNVVLGWTTAVKVTCARKNKVNAIVTGNTADGAISFEEQGAGMRKVVQGNIELPPGTAGK